MTPQCEFVNMMFQLFYSSQTDIKSHTFITGAFPNIPHRYRESPFQNIYLVNNNAVGEACGTEEYVGVNKFLCTDELCVKGASSFLRHPSEPEKGLVEL